MVFISVCTALYQYVPQGEGELAIEEGDIVYILEKSTEDDWWKATKKSSVEGEDDPVGLIPNNYVEEAQPTHHAKALYDYTRQTDEELSFTEDSQLLVYDTSDLDWTLVGLDGEYGFAPSNYIEITSEAEAKSPPSATSPQASERDVEPDKSQPRRISTGAQGPAAAIAGILHDRGPLTSPTAQRHTPPESSTLSQRGAQYTPEASDEEPSTPTAPSLPQRPTSQQIPSPPAEPTSPRSPEPQEPRSPSARTGRSRNLSVHGAGEPVGGSFHLYNINEMIEALGKKKKLPTTLGINLGTGTILIAPEKSRDGSQQEWTAEKLTHYSIEGKHVFMELVRPSKSVDFHAGSKDTALEIVAALGELAGAARMEGLREVIAASAGSGTTQRKGQILYDFIAQGDDEVTVAVGDEVIILDDTKSEEWWMVRRIKNGQEGVVPSSYVEATGTTSIPAALSGLNAGRSVVNQNRLEEERLAKEAVKSSKDREAPHVGPGVKLPERGSSLGSGQENNGSSQRSKRDSRSEGKSNAKPKPDPSKTRTWTDRSGSFKVEAQFLALKDGKIHLHKLNGVKIAVPVEKMAEEDLAYVEKVTGVSLDEDRPLADLRRKAQKVMNGSERKEKNTSPPSTNAGASIQQPPKPPEYDWFGFFLECGVSPHQCERYASNFSRDSMDESILPDVTPSVLRTLGLKEGDILRVMKWLDNKYGRTGGKSKLRNVSFGPEEAISGEAGDGVTSPGGGLFSGPGGSLKNNTRKGRPAPAVQTTDTVDPKAFQQKSTKDVVKPDAPEKIQTPLTTAPARTNDKTVGGFDDDAWDVKPSKQTTISPPPTSPVAPPPPSKSPSQAPLSGALAELSLLSTPLQPIKLHQTGNQPASTQQQTQFQPPQSQPQPQPIQQQFQQQPQFPQSQPTPQPLQQLQPQNTQQPRVLQNQFQPIPQQVPQQQQPLQGQFQPQQPAQFQQPLQQPLQQQPTVASPAFFATLGPQPTGTPLQQSYGLQGQPQQFLTQQQQQQTTQAQPQFQVNSAPRQRPQAPAITGQNPLLSPPPRPLSAPQNVSQPSNFGPPPLQPQLTGVPNQQGFNQNQALSGPSLNDLNGFRQQQQFAQTQQLQPQITGFIPQGQNFSQFNNGVPQQQNLYGQQQQQLQTQQTGFQPAPAFLNGQQTGSPFADPRQFPQQTGFQNQQTSLTPAFQGSLLPQQTGSINSILPPALQPQQTGLNDFNRPGFGQSQSVPPVPPIPQQPTLAPLIAQKTGPAPPVRFGTSEPKKLLPQPTGRRANLSQATPQNPFGF